ncbi:unknown [Gryllus bimaculatus nudivirus]|uniref:Uncharacterized protein n=1 Tax=Gryllus bimaculatus nudivirus TaxID=432587 RepID=A4L221_9VIRU|nr:hypothetical protein GrBNV_gp58 [Gryllus bimaculatus nudivirus]ABO45391.1 unknown [Gryllus bimaculatus nudivirus]
MIFYSLLILVLFISAILMLFASNSYANKELSTYQICLRNPWLNRNVYLAYDYDNNKNVIEFVER